MHMKCIYIQTFLENENINRKNQRAFFYMFTHPISQPTKETTITGVEEHDT